MSFKVFSVTTTGLASLWISLLLLLASGACSSTTAPSGRTGMHTTGSDDPRNPASGLGDTPSLICIDSSCEGEPECGGERTVTVLSGNPQKELETEQVTVKNPECDEETVDWVPEGESTPEEPPPPPEETFECPAGTLRYLIRDMWSEAADPSLGSMPAPPMAVLVIDSEWNSYPARRMNAGCDWYVACIPDDLESFQLKAVGSSGCAPGDASGSFDIRSLDLGSELFVDYVGSDIQKDYTAYPNVPIGPGGFRLTSDASELSGELCEKANPDASIPAGFTKLHIRWLWGEADETGFAGTGCADSLAGLETPPYPTGLKLSLDGCSELPVLLEFQNGDCPWYYALVPNELWQGSITIRYPDGSSGLYSPALELPTRTSQVNEYWLAYWGPPDDIAWSGQGVECLNWSQLANMYHFYTENPGPGYESCGGGGVDIDPCNPPMPGDYYAVHFRYVWAGQKTFTFFPKPEFMPTWIILELNGGEGPKDVMCLREADRPWFNCPVPRGKFAEGVTWRAVDKTRGPPEWNTVNLRPFPAEPGEYWLRWHYGKVDYSEQTEAEKLDPATEEFKFYDYYPDGSLGDWSATGNWSDGACAPKPPASPVEVGFGGWFPYDETGYAYDFGGSLALTYADSASVQDLLDYFVQERYLIWRHNYVLEGDQACGAGTARVKTDPPETVSEGQGYGIAMAAAVGDKATFDALWRFARHYLSQSANKYCGGLLGWMWDGPESCRALDQPCDPTSGSCGGNSDSAFDGDADVAIGLVYAALQWPEYREAAVGWLLKMECEINTAYDPTWAFPAPGDTWDKNCSDYPNSSCTYDPTTNGTVNLSYYPPGYFRVFGDFLERELDPSGYSADARRQHRAFWYKTAASVYELYERCYDNTDVNPGLVTDWGHYETPCDANSDNYNWARALWRVAVDAAWFGNRTDLPETQAGSSQHFSPKSRMQAKVDNIQEFFAHFHEQNPPEPAANRFSTICQNLTPTGQTGGCDPGFGHNSYFVNTAMSAFVSVFDNGGKTDPALRREALEEAVSTTVMNDRYYQESLGVYTMLFLSGNFPNPLEVP